MFARSFHGSRGFPVIYINILSFFVHTYSLKLDQYTTDGKLQSIPDKKMNTNESRSHNKIRRESYFTFSLNEKYAVLV